MEADRANMNLVSAFLDLMGITHEKAWNGIDAINKILNSRFDIVLMETAIPRINGLEVTRRLRDMEERLSISRTPIVALTGNAFKEHRRACIEAGMDGFIAKPYSMKDLQNVLAKHFFLLEAI